MTLKEYIVKHRPTHPYYVMCGTESPLKMYFVLDDALRNIERYDYVTVFDIWGDLIKEFKIIEGETTDAY